MPIDKTCENCGTSFKVKPKNAARRFCTKACVTAHEAIHGRVAAQKPLIEFSCKECGKPFFHKPSNVRAYRVKHGKDPLYCSMPCSDLGRRKDADERNKTNCKNCGKEFYRSRRKGAGTVHHEQELCSKQCKNEWVSKVYREKNGLPQITRTKARHGYIKLRIPAHDGEPLRRDVLEHRYVMEQKIGRQLLPEETVHHINGDRAFNDPSNLELFSSRHGPGQRVIDKVNFAIEMLTLYPEFARARGYELQPIHPPTADPPSHPEPRKSLPPPSSEEDPRSPPSNQ